MHRALPTLALLLLLVVPLPTSSLPVTHTANAKNTRFYPGRGAMRDGGLLMYFPKELDGAVVRAPLVLKYGSKTYSVAITSNGVIYYLDEGGTLYRQVTGCKGRVVKAVHADMQRSSKILLATCWLPSQNKMSALYIWANGHLEWSSPSKDSYMGSEQPYPFAGDVDGDGNDELLWYVDGHVWFLDNPYEDPQLFLIGKDVKGFGLGDVDGDGSEEVVVTTNSGTLTWDPSDGFHDFSSFSCSSEPVLSDLDGDGIDEISCLKGGSLISFDPDKILLTVGNVAAPPASADLNGDGKADLVYMLKNGEVEARSLSGVLWRYKAGQGANPLNSPAIGDIDGDMKPEVIVAIGSSVEVISNTGTLEWDIDLKRPSAAVSQKVGDTTWIKEVTIPLVATSPPSLGDYDGDGLLEILVGLGATGYPGRMAVIDDISGLGEPPIIEVLSPENYTTVGAEFDLKFSVSDDTTSVLHVKVYRYLEDWVEAWSGVMESGEVRKLHLPSAEQVMIEATDGTLISRAIVKLRVDISAPILEISPRNGSTIGPGDVITVRMRAPYKEYAFLSVFHSNDPRGSWVKMIDRRRVWKTTKVEINVTSLVKMIRGYHYFKFVLEDALGNKNVKIMRYRIEKENSVYTASEGNVYLSIIVGDGPFSKEVPISWRIAGVDEAILFYGFDGDWTILKEVTGNGTMTWNVSELSDGLYKLKLEAENQGKVVRAFAQVEVDNTPPSLEVKADKSVAKVGDLVKVVVTTDASKILWDLDGDGKFETLGPNTARIKIEEARNLTINVMALDEANNSAVASVLIAVTNDTVQNVSSEENTSSVEVQQEEKEKGFVIRIPLDLSWLRFDILLPAIALIALALVVRGIKRRRKKRAKETRRVVNPWLSL
ncbi:MAG: hypothetical protein J7J65_06315 [Candidatus Korarchaeota archaeon]|nr:hypothetical protein [Candidatus Korarchaeota archaeon]